MTAQNLNEQLLVKEVDSLRFEIRLQEMEQQHTNALVSLQSKLDQQDKTLENITDQTGNWVSFTEIFFGVVGLILAAFAFFGYKQISKDSLDIQKLKTQAEEQVKAANLLLKESVAQHEAIKERHLELQKINPEEVLSHASKEEITRTIKEAREQLASSGFDALKNLYLAKSIQADSDVDPDLDAVIRLSQNYLDLDDKNSAVWNRLGIALARKEKVDKSIDCFNKAIALNPESERYHFNRGNSKLREEDNQGALVDFQEAIKLNANYGNAYLGRGIVKQRLGQFESSVEDYNRAEALGIKQSELFFNHGLVLMHLKRFEEASKEFRKAIESSPNDKQYKEYEEKALKEMEKLAGRI